jgi:hypothetical protein
MSGLLKAAVIPALPGVLPPEAVSVYDLQWRRGGAQQQHEAGR